MANLVEDVVSLEKEADLIVAQARAEEKELEKLAIAEAEAYRRKQAEETEQKVVAFRKEMEAKHKSAAAETEKDLVRALNAIDQIADGRLKEEIEKIVTKFREL